MLIPSLLSLALTAYQRYLSSNGNHLFHYTLTSNFPRLHYHCLYSSLNALEFCSQCGLWVPGLKTYHASISHPESLPQTFCDCPICRMHRQLLGTSYERIPRDISCVLCQQRYHRGLSCSALPFQYRNGYFYLRCLFQSNYGSDIFRFEHLQEYPRIAEWLSNYFQRFGEMTHYLCDECITVLLRRGDIRFISGNQLRYPVTCDCCHDLFERDGCPGFITRQYNQDLVIQDQSEHCYRCVVQQYPYYKWHDNESPPWYREYARICSPCITRLYLRGDLNQIREFIHTCNYGG